MSHKTLSIHGRPAPDRRAIALRQARVERRREQTSELRVSLGVRLLRRLKALAQLT